MGVIIDGVRLPANFQCPRAAKLCVRLPNVLEVQERDRGPLSPCQIWWASNFTSRRGGEKQVFLSIIRAFLSLTLLNARVCALDFAVKALEYRNDFDAVG